MAEAAVACGACGKKFAWKPQFAGKKMKCKCGSPLEVPLEPPEPAEMPQAVVTAAASMARAPSKPAPSARRVVPPPPPPKKAPPPPLDLDLAGVDEVRLEPMDHGDPGMGDGDDVPILDLEPAQPIGRAAAAAAGSTTCPSCSAPLAIGAILCVGCGYNLALRRKMLSSPKKAIKDDDSPGTDMAWRIREHIAPPILVVVGLALQVGFTGAEYGGGYGFIAVGVLLYTAIACALMVGACFISAGLLDTNFGSIHTAAVKLAGIFLITDGVIDALEYATGGYGMMNMWVGYPIYYGLLMWLFELDGFEVAVCAVIFWMVRIAAFFLFVFIAFKISLSGFGSDFGDDDFEDSEYEMIEGGQFGSDADYMEPREFWESDREMPPGDPEDADFEAAPPPVEAAPAPAPAPGPATPGAPGAPGAPQWRDPGSPGARLHRPWPWADQARAVLARIGDRDAHRLSVA